MAWFLSTSRLDDGPGERTTSHGREGTFERTSAGRRLQDAARARHAPLRVSVNTTVAHETLDALTEMVDVAEQLGVDAIGLNHLMYSTPEEVDETVRLLGTGDASSISTFVTTDPGLDPERVRRQVDRLAARCRERGVRFAMPTKVRARSSSRTTRPGRRSKAVVWYPFLYARVSFSGKAYFCPFIRI